MKIAVHVPPLSVHAEYEGEDVGCVTGKFVGAVGCKVGFGVGTDDGAV